MSVTIRSFLELETLFLRESEHPGFAGSLWPRHGTGGLRGHEARAAAGARGRGWDAGLGRPRQLLHPGPRARLADQILPGQADQDAGQVDRQHREDYVWWRCDTWERWWTKQSIFQFLNVWRVWECVPVPWANWTFSLRHTRSQKVKVRKKILFNPPSAICLDFSWTRPTYQSYLLHFTTWPLDHTGTESLFL